MNLGCGFIEDVIIKGKSESTLNAKKIYIKQEKQRVWVHHIESVWGMIGDKLNILSL